MPHWDLCIHIRSYLQTLGSMPFAFGFVYCIGIHDSALGHDKDTMLSHLPHGPLKFALLAQLDVLLTFMHYYSLLGPPMGAIDAFHETITSCSSYRCVG
jgi:hypothetical protein